MYLCPLFFGKSRRLVGHQSKAGIIVHEWSHFDDIGGTSDHHISAYASAYLAEWNPEAALDNAYSIQYFAENVPHLD
ncbi:hypothetical protein F5887DRAFT_961298 [Amanita rubescens]|nr:hypothetical protein F5887DRAFT_961298 [Amanita rubescens]